MYDTLKLRLEHEVDLSLIGNLLEHPTCGINNYAREFVRGRLQGLEFYAEQSFITLTKGSICKWYKGNNFETMTIEDTCMAIQKLSAIFCLPFEKAVITRLDFGPTFVVDYDPSIYFNKLSNISRYKRLTQPSGLYFSMGIRQIALYNKIKEAKAHRDSIPLEFCDKNVIRCELRLTRKISRQLGEKQITAEMLYQPCFFIKLLDMWYNLICSIKTDTNKCITNGVRNVRTFQRYLVRDWSHSIGGHAASLQFIEDCRKVSQISNKAAYDIKTYIDKNCSLPIDYNETDLIHEFRQTIDRIYNDHLRQCSKNDPICADN